MGVSPRPDAAEVAAGLARFLAAEILPATEDRALRRELKVAVALLETISLQTTTEHGDDADLEERARAAELTRDPSLRARLLADLDRTDALLTPLRQPADRARASSYSGSARVSHHSGVSPSGRSGGRAPR